MITFLDGMAAGILFVYLCQWGARCLQRRAERVRFTRLSVLPDRRQGQDAMLDVIQNNSDVVRRIIRNP